MIKIGNRSSFIPKSIFAFLILNTIHTLAIFEDAIMSIL